VIDATVAKARALGLPARALTFEPHPRAVLQPQQPPFRLTPPAAKERLLKACGIESITVLPFTVAFSNLGAQEFVEQILLEQADAQHIVAGHDFVFGYGRSGDMQKLATWLAPHRAGVTEITPLSDEQGRVFSSTRARAFLQQGDLSAAAEILGRDWSIAGTIVKGAGRGRTIGIPTANISLGAYLRPRFGVYAIRAGRVGEPLTQRGVANIGIRPTVDGASQNLEAHLFDFDEDIYGQDWEFALTRFIRDEVKFDSLAALKAQIARDIASAG
jgi:riboflavin kinase/FMN adenylyltransferase